MWSSSSAAGVAFNRRRIGGFFFFFSSSSSSSAAAEIPSLKPHFMAEYLVRVFGFSSDEASKASQPLSHLKSTQKPDSVLSLLRSHGLDDALIRTIITRNPRFLCHNADKTLATNFRSLRDLGFSDPDLAKVILSHPQAFNHRTLVPKVQFWRELVGSHDQFMRLLDTKMCILSASLEKRLTPNLSILRGCGLPDRRIALIIRTKPNFIAQRPERLAALVDRVKGLGIPCSSGMFGWALRIAHFTTEAKFNSKMQLMQSFGWSESEFLSAFRKSPVFLSVSEKIMRRKMEFFVTEAGCEPSYLAFYPSLLMYSMERRLVPRHRVLRILTSRGLHNGKYTLGSIMSYPDKKFMDRFVIPYEEKAPELKGIWVSNGDAL